MFNLAYRMCGNAEEASDLSQEIFLRVYRNLDKHDSTRPFGPWLYRVGHNLGINFVTRRPKRMLPIDARRGDGGGALHEPPSDAPSAHERVEHDERAEQVRTAVLELKPDQRAIVTLHYFQGLSYDELADTLELPIGTVKNRLFRARETLRAILEGSVPA
ncbi:MAG: RNA polymerase sigma factor [Planctomycetota bacterium]